MHTKIVDSILIMINEQIIVRKEYFVHLFSTTKKIRWLEWFKQSTNLAKAHSFQKTMKDWYWS